MADLNLIAVEGVQGAGKSTFIKTAVQFQLAMSILPITELARPKMMADSIDNGAGLSTLTDIAWFLGAMKRWQSEGLTDRPILIDRFIVSQWVYGNLREAKNPPIHELVSQIWEMEAMLGYLAKSYMGRSGLGRSLLRSMLGMSPSISLSYLFLLPSKEVIESRRENTGSTYAFPVDAELEMYNKAYSGLLDARITTAVYRQENSIFHDEGKLDATLLSLFSQ